LRRFNFKLQKLLDLRESKEEKIKNELAKVLTIQNKERIKQDELRHNINEQRMIFSKKIRKGGYPVNNAIIFEKFVDTSYKAIDAAEIKIQVMEPEIQKIRDRLIEASKERKVVEKLKERKLEEYNYELNRELAKENDDVNQNIFNRKILELN